MKKQTHYTNPSNKDFDVNKDIEIDKLKTTNVNILLNRVRLDKKKTLKKNIIVSLLLVGFICSIAISFNI